MMSALRVALPSSRAAVVPLATNNDPSTRFVYAKALLNGSSSRRVPAQTEESADPKPLTDQQRSSNEVARNALLDIQKSAQSVQDREKRPEEERRAAHRQRQSLEQIQSANGVSGGLQTAATVAIGMHLGGMHRKSSDHSEHVSHGNSRNSDYENDRSSSGSDHEIDRCSDVDADPYVDPWSWSTSSNDDGVW